MPGKTGICIKLKISELQYNDSYFSHRIIDSFLSVDIKMKHYKIKTSFVSIVLPNEFYDFMILAKHLTHKLFVLK